MMFHITTFYAVVPWIPYKYNNESSLMELNILEAKLNKHDLGTKFHTIWKQNLVQQTNLETWYKIPHIISINYK